MTSIAALLVKTSSENTILMQLAENIHRENLSLDDECKAISTLYACLGSLDKVATAIKKSKPWCSKRYAMTQKGLHYAAQHLLEDGITEDIDLLKSLSKLINIVGWTQGNEWANKIREGKAGRNEIRTALKKEKDKPGAIMKATPKVSHAKPKTPPPPPAWNVEEALDDLADTLINTNNKLTAIDILNNYTEAQREEIKAKLNHAAAIGAGNEGFKIIGNLVLNGLYKTQYTDIDLLAMIAGYRKNEPINLTDFLAELQTPKEKA